MYWNLRVPNSTVATGKRALTPLASLPGRVGREKMAWHRLLVHVRQFPEKLGIRVHL